MDDLHHQLQPLSYLPDELLACIFEHVHADWERLHSPFQLLHVSRRWRKVALTTPNLWRDMRILRVMDKLLVRYEQSFHPVFHPVRKTFCFGATEPPPGHLFERKDVNQWELMRMTTQLARSTLTLFEVEVDLRDHAATIMQQPFEGLAGTSTATLKSISITDKNRIQRRAYKPSGRSEFDGSLLAAIAVDFVLQCPRLHTVELRVGELLFAPRPVEYDDPIEAEESETDPQFDFKSLRSPATPASSFVNVRIDSYDGFNMPRGAQMRERFLQRCSQIRFLSIASVPNPLLRDQPSSPPPPFAHQLLAACAQTLERLEVSGQENIPKRVVREGTSSFPRLQHFKHVAHSGSYHEESDAMDGMTTPEIQSVNAPIEIIAALPLVPDLVTVRIGRLDRYEDDCNKIAEWLLGFGKEQGPRLLTLLVTIERARLAPFERILAALTPSDVGQVACGNLERLSILRRAPFYPEQAGECFFMDPVPVPRPVAREAWEAWTLKVSHLARMEAERRRVSQGLPPTEYEVRASSRSAAVLPHEGSSKRVALANDDHDVKEWPRCEALESIEIEGCYVQPEAWQIMKASVCSFSVTPDPDEMSKLPSKAEFNEQGHLYGQPELQPW